MARIMKINERIEHLDPYSEERDAFATAIFGESVQISFRRRRTCHFAGRNSLIIKFAGLSDEATIVGKGEIF